MRFGLAAQDGWGDLAVLSKPFQRVVDSSVGEEIFGFQLLGQDFQLGAVLLEVLVRLLVIEQGIPLTFQGFQLGDFRRCQVRHCGRITDDLVDLVIEV